MSAYTPPQKQLASQSNDSQNQTSPLLYEEGDIREFLQVGVETKHLKTLICSPPTDDSSAPQLLGFMLYLKQHPDWQSSQQLLCKSNLDTLRDAFNSTSESTEETSGDHPSKQVYPVFEESKRKLFTFCGWFRIGNVEVIEGKDPRLYEAFSRKYEHDGKKVARSREKWQKSFSQPWAFVTLIKDEKRLNIPPKRT